MKKSLAALAILAAGISLACVALAFPSDLFGVPQQNSRGAIRVQSDLVDILASVTDADGHPIPDLTQDAFALSEQGVPQKIERFEAETNRPLDLALMVDSSMSALKELKLETEAAAHFIRQVVRPGDTLGVFEFDEIVTELSEFSATCKGCNRPRGTSHRVRALQSMTRWSWVRMPFVVAPAVAAAPSFW